MRFFMSKLDLLTCGDGNYQETWAERGFYHFEVLEKRAAYFSCSRLDIQTKTYGAPHFGYCHVVRFTFKIV